jgi:membrane protease YdiL (CAAX protease family)
MQVATVPPPPSEPRVLRGEILVVLAASVLASAAFAIVDLFKEPLRGVIRFSASQNPFFLEQVLAFVFGLAPVYLVIHLVRRTGEGTAGLGLAWDRPRSDLSWGAVLFAVVGVAGVGVYLAAVELGVNRFVVPAPPAGHWWTYLAVFMNAADAALLEEIIVVAFLMTRLRQLEWGPVAAIAASSLLRASYHLYQGWGGFFGNLAMGVLFAWFYTRTRRVWPLIVTHFLLDVFAALGYLWFRDRLPGFA